MNIRRGLSGDYIKMQLPLLFLLMILSSMVIVPLGAILYLLLTGGTFEQFISILTSGSDGLPESIDTMSFLNGLQSVALFIIPPIAFAALASDNYMEYLKLKPINSKQLSLIVVLFLASLPMTQFLAYLNSGVEFPDFMSGVESWMRESENYAMELTKKFLVMDSVSDLLMNLFLIAVIPAIGEEFIFRGVIQKIVTRWSGGNYHKGIWISAIIFSAIHLQFYGFVPRMVLGALLGYSLVWGGSIWYPIIGHFINNGLAVIAVYFTGVEVLDSGSEDQKPEWYIVILSCTVVAIILTKLYRRYLDSKD